MERTHGERTILVIRCVEVVLSRTRYESIKIGGFGVLVCGAPTKTQNRMQNCMQNCMQKLQPQKPTTAQKVMGWGRCRSW